MASPARAAARAQAAEGLSREELESGHAWAVATRRCALRLEHRLHRKNGAAKVLRAILRYQAAKVTVIDRRALGTIARAAHVSRRHCRAMIAKLERHGYAVRVRHAGVRLPGQRGWKTSGLVVLENLANTDLLPPTARRRALEWDLADPRIRAALESRGVTVPSNPTLRARLERLQARHAAEIAAEEEAAAKAVAKALAEVPADVPLETVWQGLTEVAAEFEPVAAEPLAEPEAAHEVASALPAVVAAVVGALAAGTENAQASIAGKALAPAVDKSTENRMDRAPMGFGFCSSDRNCQPPTSIAPAAVDRTIRGAIAPFPPITPPPPASTVPEGPPSPAPPAAGERQNGPRLAPTTHRTCAAGSRRESWPTLPVELRGPHVQVREVIAWYEAHSNKSRSQILQHVTVYRKAEHARSRRIAEDGHLPGPKLHYRAAAKEHDRTQRAGRLAVVAEGKRGISTWTQLRGELANRATEAEWYGPLGAVECRNERLGTGGQIILDLDGPEEVRDHVAQIAATLPRVQITWPEPPPPPEVAEADRWPTILAGWETLHGEGDTVWRAWIASLRLLGWATEEGTLIVSVTGDLDVLARLRFYRARMSDRASKVLGVQVRVSLEAS